MNCSRELIDGYIDGELDPFQRHELEQHLAGCQNCSEDFAQIRELQDAIRLSAPRYKAPAGLRQSVHDGLLRAASDGDRPRAQDALWRWTAVAACLCLAVSLFWNFSHLHQKVPQQELLAENILADHVRSLMASHLLDVVSSDRHTVKPWFNGKLDFSPDVKDFASQGFPLLGGRIEYLSGRTVAALVYQRRKHVINLFTWPLGSGDPKDNVFSRNGYHELQWSDGSMTYWAVSDLGIGELQEFRDLWKR